MTVTTLYDRATERRYQESLERAEREQEQEKATKEMLKGLLLDSLKSGQDVILPTGNPYLRYPVSEYLGECSKEAQQMLFRLCVAIAHGNEADALIWGRKYTERVATDYAERYFDAFMALED